MFAISAISAYKDNAFWSLSDPARHCMIVNPGDGAPFRRSGLPGALQIVRKRNPQVDSPVSVFTEFRAWKDQF